MLDGIPGVGPARRKALMRCFSSIDEIRGATVQELCERAQLPLPVGQEIYDFFRKGKEEETVVSG